MFEYFKRAKNVELKALKRLAEAGRLPPLHPEPRLDFAGRLRRRAAEKGLAVIAEYKRASPSQGDIALGVTPDQAALAFIKAGAAAMSILTEKSKFKGRLNFINRAWDGGAELFDLPLLRKDFIFDSLQVRATASGPASALLLIVRLTPDALQLRDLRQEAEAYGLATVVEVFDEADLGAARKSGARIIQANARDFSDLSVDLRRSLDLARRHAGEAEELWIAASGFSKPLELLAAGEAGFTAILAGTALMRGGRLDESLKHLTSALKKEEHAPCHIS
jgi:indole-3-glycerol phosphate synthase